jgi:spore maturation protein CgeB
MRIIQNTSEEYRDVIVDYLCSGLAKYNDNSTDKVLFLGYNTSHNLQLKNTYAKFNKRMYLNWEAPCSFVTTKTSMEEQKYFTHVYTICPYTAEWAKDKTATQFIPIPFPINLNVFKDITWNKEKEIDAIYTGTLIHAGYYEIIDVIRNYKYIFTSLINYQYPYNPTHINISCIDKWKLLSKSKINVVINHAGFGASHIANIKSYKDWEKHDAFKNISSGIMPQFKSRITEAMGLKTLNLVKRDEWNVIEKWFKPDVHFVYWDNKNDLKEKINYILKNYDQYQKIINDAYEEVKKYDIDYMYNNDFIK